MWFWNIWQLLASKMCSVRSSICVIILATMLNMSWSSNVTTGQHHNQTSLESNTTCSPHWEVTWQTKELKRCPGQDKCIPISVPCAELCSSEGVGSNVTGASDCPDRVTCVDLSAGDTCRTCGDFERRCPTGECMHVTRSCPAQQCGPRRFRCHDGTCQIMPYFCDCSDFHTICKDGSCKYFSFDCPERGLFPKDTHRNSLDYAKDKDESSQELLYVVSVLGVCVSFVMSCMCYRRQRAAAAAAAQRGTSDTMQLQARTFNNAPSHYPVPPGSSSVVLPPLARPPPEYEEIMQQPPDGDGDRAVGEGGEQDNALLPSEPPPSYSSVCQVHP